MRNTPRDRWSLHISKFKCGHIDDSFHRYMVTRTSDIGGPGVANHSTVTGVTYLLAARGHNKGIDGSKKVGEHNGPINTSTK